MRLFASAQVRRAPKNGPGRSCRLRALTRPPPFPSPSSLPSPPRPPPSPQRPVPSAHAEWAPLVRCAKDGRGAAADGGAWGAALGRSARPGRSPSDRKTRSVGPPHWHIPSLSSGRAPPVRVEYPSRKLTLSRPPPPATLSCWYLDSLGQVRSGLGRPGPARPNLEPAAWPHWRVLGSRSQTDSQTRITSMCRCARTAPGGRRRTARPLSRLPSPADREPAGRIVAGAGHLAVMVARRRRPFPGWRRRLGDGGEGWPDACGDFGWGLQRTRTGG
jgi:hypothetical protein